MLNTRDFISTSQIANELGVDPRLVASVLYELKDEGRVEMRRERIRGAYYLFWRRRR